MRLIRLFVLIASLMSLTTTLTLMLGRMQSTDGLWTITFTHNRIAGWHLVEILPNGNTVEQPTSLQGQLFWSPDYQWVAYLELIGNSQKRLVRSHPDGSDHQILVENATNFQGTVKWSPDGESLFFTDLATGSGYDIFRLNVNTLERERLGLFGLPFCCQWSPDEEWLLVDGGTSVHRLRSDGTQLETIFESSDSDVSYPQYALNGQTIVFTAYTVPRTSIIYRADVNGENLQQLSPSDYSFLPSVSPDGTQVVFLATDLNTFYTSLYRKEIGKEQVYTLTDLTDYFYDYNPFLSNLIWSPMGDNIIFLAIHQNQQGLFQVPIDGGEIQTLFNVTQGRAIAPHYIPFQGITWRGWQWFFLSILGLGFSYLMTIRDLL